MFSRQIKNKRAGTIFQRLNVFFAVVIDLVPRGPIEKPILQSHYRINAKERALAR